jgi:acetylglutamate kinase
VTLPTVVKLGGNAVTQAGIAALAADLATLARDRPLLLVHGGGPQTTALQEQLGQTPRRVAGRRITDGPTLDAIKMVVGGKLNIDLCAALVAAGAKPVGLHGASSLVIEAERRPPTRYPGSDDPVDLGLVGDVIQLNHELLGLLLDGGYVPVLACIGAGSDGTVYNINADTVANRVAVELKADALALVSDIRGVLRDVRDPNSRIATMTAAEATRAIDDGSVTGGMIAKLQEALEAIERGVRRIHIVGQLSRGELQRELDHPGSVGTALTA